MKADEIEYKLERIEKIVKQIRDFCIVALIILTLLLFSGCASLEHTDKDGNVTKYFRIGNQQIGEGLLRLPDGSELLFEGQKSDLPTVTVTLPVGAFKIGNEVKP